MIRLITICSFLMAMSATGASAQENYSLKGRIPVFGEEAKAFLMRGNKIDSTQIASDGSFDFSGDITEPVRARLVLAKNLDAAYRSAPFSLYLEQGVLRVSSPDSIANAHVEGGQANRDYKALDDQLAAINNLQGITRTWYNGLTEEERELADNKRKYKDAQNDLETMRKERYRQFFVEHNDSPIAIDMLKVYGGFIPEFDEVNPEFQKLTEGVRNSEAGRKYAAELAVVEKLGVGRMAPEFSQLDTAGKLLNLRDLRGKYVLIDFWASWCKPCRLENPHVVKAFETHKDDGFTVLGVSLDDERSKAAWIKAIYDDHIEIWPQVSDLKGWKNEAAVLYNVRAIPQNYLIDPEGKIIAKNLRGEGLHEKLAELFK